MKLKKLISLFLSMILTLSFLQITPVIFAEVSSDPVFQDSLNDLSKISDYGLIGINFYQCNSGSNIAGDQAVMIDSGAFDALKDSSGQMVVYPYFTWKVNGGAKVEFFTYLWDAGYNFTLSWSADGCHFNNIALDSVQIDEITEANKVEKGLGDEYLGGAPDVTHRLYTISQIDATARFFKVTWPKIDGSWKAAPSMVRFTGGQENAVDESHNKEISMSNNQEADTADMAAYKDAFEYNQAHSGVPVLMVKYDYLNGKSTVEKPYVIYKIDDTKAFMASFIAHETFFKMNAEIKFYSSDAVDGNWTEVFASKGRVPFTGNGGISYLNYTVPSLPAGQNFIKVEYPFDKDYTNVTWSDGTPGTPGNPLTYMVSLQSVAYTEYVAPAVEDIEADTVISIQGNAESDQAQWSNYTKNMFDFDQKLNGVPFLALSYYSVVGKTTLPEIFVTYKVKAGSPFMMKSVRHVRFTHLQLDMKLFSSEDGETWQEITNCIFSSKPSEALGFDDETFIVESLPATHKYVKIVYPNTKDYTGTPDPVDGDTLGDPITYGVGLVSVKFNKSDDLPEANDMQNVVFTGDESVDSLAWENYSKNTFDFDQKLDSLPFLSLQYNAVFGKQTLPEIYVIYKTKAGSPFILNSITHRKMIDIGKKFKIYTSADLTAWTEVTNYDYKLTAGANDWSTEKFTLASMDATHQYVKIVWPNEKDYTGTEDPVTHEIFGDPLHYAPGLVSASFIAPDPEEEEPEEEPDLSDITGNTVIQFTGNKANDSSKMTSLNEDAIDFSQMLQIGDDNIPVLMLKYDFVSGKSTLPEAFITYKVAEGSPLKIEGYTHVNALALDLKLKIYGSSDGTNWSALEDYEYVSESIPDSNWLKEIYGIEELPAGIQYIKIVWPNEKDYTGVQNPEDGTILDSLNYAPAIEKITFNAASVTSTDDNSESENEENPTTGDYNSTLFPLMLLAAIVAAGALMNKKKKDAEI